MRELCGWNLILLWPGLFNSDQLPSLSGEKRKSFLSKEILPTWDLLPEVEHSSSCPLRKEEIIFISFVILFSSQEISSESKVIKFILGKKEALKSKAI